MTREQLIKAIFHEYNSWNCPDDGHCNLPEESENIDCCYNCAEKQLADYEKAIIEKTSRKLKPIKVKLQNFTKHDYKCPVCGAYVGNDAYFNKGIVGKYNFCKDCGQAIDWSV